MLHGVQREGEKNEKYKSVDHVISLKDVKLSIVPAIVQYLNDSTLQCSYDLEDDILYSVKWYRGLREFYRYTPSEHPKTKVFPFDGITVDVSSYAGKHIV
ncbi:hypothetical protein D910_00978 [Dendroctonus ponderosae]